MTAVKKWFCLPWLLRQFHTNRAKAVTSAQAAKAGTASPTSKLLTAGFFERNFTNVPEAAFTTIRFLRNLRMCPIS